TPAHAIIAGTETAADDDGEFGHARAGDRGNELGAILGNALRLVFLADHEAGDVLQKDERDFALRAKFNEMGALERRFRKQDSIIGEDAHGIADNVRESADEGCSIERLELVEHAAVDDPGKDFARVVSLARIGGGGAVYFLRVV